MPAITILLGIALMAVGIGTFATSKEQSLTLLLPALFGLLTLGLGIGSVIKADLRKHLMHAAVLLATLGVLIPVIQLLLSSYLMIPSSTWTPFSHWSEWATWFAPGRMPIRWRLE